MREARAFRPYLFLCAGLVALMLIVSFFAPTATDVRAQAAPPGAAQITGRAATTLPADGAYFANDDFKFTIAHKYGVTLLRFAGNDEVFVLSVERGPVGGRVLKYDTGDVALQVTGYGGVTLYTSTAPGGLPADRVGDGEPITFPVPATPALRLQAQQFADKLQQTDGVTLSFNVDWSRLDDGASRYLALDAMRIAARAISGICANHANQGQVAAKLHAVRVMRGERPGAFLKNGVLTVTVAPVFGLRGRLSSLAVARAIRAQL